MQKFRKFSDKDLKKLKDYIYRQKKPLFIETNDIVISLILKKSAKLKYLNEGYLSMTIDELYELIKEEKDFEKQKQVIQEKIKKFKEYSILIQKVKDVFQGRIEEFEIFEK